MKLLNKVKNIHKEACVSIIMNTHRTKPDNIKDEIVLKNLIKETENRLNDKYDKQLVLSIMENINKVISSINHNFNLESLIICANNDFAEFTRLPIKVEDRVVIDYTFATRDLIRAMHSESAYYVLVLSRQQARLIEAYGDKAVNELKGSFPIKDIKTEFQTSAMLMEKAGTGGSLFRNLYRDFLKESAELLKSKEIMECHHEYSEVADLWKKVSELFYKAGETKDIKYINQASEILINLSEKEKKTMEKLKQITI